MSGFYSKVLICEGILPMKSKSRNCSNSNQQSNGFQELSEKKSPELAAEFLDFLRHNKKLWLAPIIVFLLFFGILAMLGGTGVAPFIYTLF
jgi:hypothetical protein